LYNKLRHHFYPLKLSTLHLHLTLILPQLRHRATISLPSPPPKLGLSGMLLYQIRLVE
jgi:hypothetical protein